MAFSFTAPGSANRSRLTFGEAKRRVGRATGARDRPDEHGAGDAIQEAIDELNAWRWKFLGVTGTNISIVAASSVTVGQEGYEGLYTLPTPFASPESLIITGSPNRKLVYVTRNDWDQVVRSPVGGTYFYTDFNAGQTGQIQLLDPPSANGTMEIRYYRPMVVPQNDDEILDIKDGPMTAFIITKAKEIVGADRGLFANRVDMYARRAERLLMKAWGEDNVAHDFIPQMLPYNVWADGRVVNINSPNYWTEVSDGVL